MVTESWSQFEELAPEVCSAWNEIQSHINGKIIHCSNKEAGTLLEEVIPLVRELVQGASHAMQRQWEEADTMVSEIENEKV